MRHNNANQALQIQRGRFACFHRVYGKVFANGFVWASSPAAALKAFKELCPTSRGGFVVREA